MVLSLLSGATELALVAGSLALALLAFLAFNLELPFFRGRKIFLGDGGSTSSGSGAVEKPPLRAGVQAMGVRLGSRSRNPGQSPIPSSSP